MNILIAIPIYYRDELAYNCAMSLVRNTVVPNDVHVTIAFGVNKCGDELKGHLTNLSLDTTNRVSIKFHDFNENIGKPSVVNRLSAIYQFDYLISLDGDMICIQPDWLVNLIGLYSVCEKLNPDKMGAMCGNQFGACCHILNEQSPSALVWKCAGFTLIGHMHNEGVAGGILMTNSRTWKTIGGYDSTKIYGGDDGYYSNRCAQIGKQVVYVKEVGFYHPFDLNKSYAAWKAGMLREINNGERVTEKREGFFG